MVLLSGVQEILLFKSVSMLVSGLVVDSSSLRFSVIQQFPSASFLTVYVLPSLVSLNVRCETFGLEMKDTIFGIFAILSGMIILQLIPYFSTAVIIRRWVWSEAEPAIFSPEQVIRISVGFSSDFKISFMTISCFCFSVISVMV